MQARDLFRYKTYFSDSSNHDLSIPQMAVAAHVYVGKTCFVLHQQNEIPSFLRSLQRNKNGLNARFQYLFYDDEQMTGHWCTGDVLIANNQLEFYIFDGHAGMSMLTHIRQIVNCCPGAKITGSTFVIQDANNCAWDALHRAYVFKTTPDLHEKLRDMPSQPSRFDSFMSKEPGWENIKLLFDFLPKTFGSLFETDMSMFRRDSKGKGYLRQDGTSLDEFFVGKDTALDVLKKNDDETNSPIYLQKQAIKNLIVPFVQRLIDSRSEGGLEEFNGIFDDRDGLDAIDKLARNARESKSSPMPQLAGTQASLTTAVTTITTTTVSPSTTAPVLTAGMYGSYSQPTTVVPPPTQTQTKAQPEEAAEDIPFATLHL